MRRSAGRLGACSTTFSARLLVERWTDRQAQQLHLKQPHMERFFQIRDRCLDKSSLLEYDL